MAIKQEMYRLIIMDINMPPGMDGKVTTQRIKAKVKSYLEKNPQPFRIVANTACLEE